MLRRYRDDMGPGDVFIMNDPSMAACICRTSSSSSPSTWMAGAWPFSASVCHHTDVGGRVAGSNASDSTETYAEGLRIAPLKFYAGGEPNQTLIALIEKNVRLPVKVFGDLRAQLAACHIAEQQFLELVERYGIETVHLYMEEVIDYAERMTRAAIRELPDGVYSFEDWIDDDGIDFGKPIRLFVTLTKKADGIVADWTGSSPQVKGAINATLSFTKAAVYTAIRCVLPNNIPSNEGVFRAIEVFAPPGTITNCVLPAACAARGLTGFRMLDCCFGAVAMMLPDRVCAGVRRRQHRRHHRRLLCGPLAVHLRRLHHRGLGAGGRGPTAWTAIQTCSSTWPRSRSR